MLTFEDWRSIRFYERVREQVINQTPMGTKDGGVVLMPRLEGYEAALRIYGYPEGIWVRLVEDALLLHHALGDKRSVARTIWQGWKLRYHEVTEGRVIDGDAD